ncbi:MAG: alpha-2,3-sialyltransferase [Brevinemataceae bacterium]
MRKTSVVIAGCGPSVGQINYRRVPKEFDCFRMNQFAFEEKYFLGKNVTAYFKCPEFIKEAYLYCCLLERNKEYFFKDFYLTGNSSFIAPEFQGVFSSVYDILNKNPLFQRHILFYEWFYTVWPTSGTMALLTAISLGYKEIYLVGIDFYQKSSTYVYQESNHPVFDELRQQTFSFNNFSGSFFFNKGEEQQYHNIQMEKESIILASSIPGIKIYSICDDTPLNELLPLAPEKDDHFEGAEEKSANALLDFVKSPVAIREEMVRQKTLEVEQKYIKRKMQIAFDKKGMQHEWTILSSNAVVKVIFNMLKCIKIIIRFMIKRNIKVKK